MQFIHLHSTTLLTIFLSLSSFPLLFHSFSSFSLYPSFDRVAHERRNLSPGQMHTLSAFRIVGRVFYCLCELSSTATDWKYRHTPMHTDTAIRFTSPLPYKQTHTGHRHSHRRPNALPRHIHWHFSRHLFDPTPIVPGCCVIIIARRCTSANGGFGFFSGWQCELKHTRRRLGEVKNADRRRNDADNNTNTHQPHTSIGVPELQFFLFSSLACVPISTNVMLINLHSHKRYLSFCAREACFAAAQTPFQHRHRRCHRRRRHCRLNNLASLYFVCFGKKWLGQTHSTFPNQSKYSQITVHNAANMNKIEQFTMFWRRPFVNDAYKSDWSETEYVDWFEFPQ